ncbi:MAG: hypothetical protein ACI4FV_01505 [Lachnospiraceae bacterium]
MAVDSIINGLVSGVTGNTNRAYILMHIPFKDLGTDYNSPMNIMNAAFELQNAPYNAGLLKSGLSAMGYDSKLRETANNNYYIPVQVQFNPSSIRFSGMAGEIRRDSVGGYGENQFQQFDSPAETVLGMQLIFDDTNNKDAFMMDAEIPVLSEIASIGGLTQRIEQGVSALRGKEYSVQDATELFVGAMTQNYTRMVGFAWNKMVFWGELVSTSVQYTMFNKTGAPIRATVDIQIRQDKAATKDSAYKTEKQWDDAFDDMFKANAGNNAFGIKNSNATNWLNGNFLNLG